VASSLCLFLYLIEKSIGLLAENNLLEELKQEKCWKWSIIFLSANATLNDADVDKFLPAYY